MENVYDLTATVLYPDGRSENTESSVISEHNLTIIVNERPAYRLVCTKDHLRELVVGRLLTDGLIESADDIYKILFCKYENEASVFLNREIDWAWKDSSPVTDMTCCTGNRILAQAAAKGSKDRPTKLPAGDPDPKRTEMIFSLVQEFKKGTKLHDSTGGTHVCILAAEGRIVFTGEDIGRHNAVDKAVGYALLNDIDLSGCMLFTSGRVPVDMVEKVISAGIPVLVSKSVPTKESVEMAKQYGLDLVCSAWPDQCLCYT